MACPQTLSGLVHDCAANMGGIKAVYLANKADVDSVTVSTNKVTAITMVSSKFFKKYEFARRTGSLSSNWQVNAENGTKFVQTDLLLVFNRMETTKRVEIAAMAAGELVAIVEARTTMECTTTSDSLKRARWKSAQATASPAPPSQTATVTPSPSSSRAWTSPPRCS